MTPNAPAPIVPTPASRFRQLRGRRVIVGVPGIGFRGDLRADDPVVHGSRTYVPVLPEPDYYRAETEQTEVFAPLVPIDRVWVEHAAGTDMLNMDVGSTLDAPARREPMAASCTGQTTGRRMIQAVPDGYIRDLRAVTDVYVGSHGGASVRVCGEPDWYRWAQSGSMPSIVEVPVNLLWIE